MSMGQIAEVLGALARALVDRPEAVRISEHETGGELLLELDVDPADRGRIIGRRGETIQALRALLGAIAQRHHLRCRVEVAE
jgi:predicted RNA-binding protein YlqC (UPF0109 family)